MAKFLMPDFRGYFWLPESPNSKVPGRCHWTPDNTIELEIIGTFSGDVIEPHDRVEVGRILGVTEKGKPVTLENCFYRRRTFNFPGLAASTLHVNFALIGFHCAKGEKLEFDSISCHAEAIDEWLEYGPITISVERDPKPIQLSFVRPAPLEWKLSNGVTLDIDCSWSIPSGNQFRQAAISKQTWATFKFNNKTPLEELFRHANRFIKFVSFVLDQTFSFDAVHVYSSNHVEEIGASGTTRPVQIEAYFSPVQNGEPDLAYATHPYPLFAFDRVRGNFGEVLSKWFDNYEKFDSSFNLYFATKAGRDLYLHNRFGMLVQALEALHRHSSSESTFPTEDYSELCQLLFKTIPGRFRDWLEARTEYGNEPALRQRLRSLFKGLESVYGTAQDIKKVINQIVTTRNYLTHYDHELRTQVARGTQLYKLCLVLETLFQLHMAKMCGFSDSEVIAFSEESQLFVRKIRGIRDS
jgi:hypothetical protein